MVDLRKKKGKIKISTFRLIESVYLLLPIKVKKNILVFF